MAKNLYNLTEVTTVNDSDLLHVNQGSVSSDKKVTKQNLLKEVNSSITSLNNSLNGSVLKGVATISANSSKTFAIGGSSRILLCAFSFADHQTNIFLVTSTSGGVTFISPIGTSSSITTSVNGTNITMTSSAGNSIYVCVVIFNGSIDTV